MKIEIWSDIVCPFCYIGKRRLEKALQDFPGRDKVEIEWKSFQLDPAMDNSEGLSVHQYLARRKGVSEEEARRMNAAMAAMAADLGLEYNFDKGIINNTMNAHRLLHFAREKGVQSHLKERIFRAYYTEGLDTADEDTLVELAQSVGLDGTEARRVLQSDEYREEVLADQQLAEAYRIQGVPFYIFNGKYGVSGAQAPEVFSQVLGKVWEEERPVVIAGGEGSCDTDGNCN